MSDGGEEDRKTRILVNGNWSSLVNGLNERTSKVIFLVQERLSEEELVLPFDGALYLPPTNLSSLLTEKLDEEVDEFEKFGCVVGLEGKCLGIWVEGVIGIWKIQW